MGAGLMTVLPFRTLERAPQAVERVALNMAQLSPFGISEQWLLRHCGDRHWALIASALGQERALFRDPMGRSIYAAFCATSLELTPPGTALLGERAEIRSSLFQISPSRIGSSHLIAGPDGRLARLRMISCFVTHDGDGSNRHLLRSAPAGLADLLPAPEPLIALDQQARRQVREFRSLRPQFPPCLTCTPSLALDFNAVGLLYFPVFSQIAERAQGRDTALLRRDLVYLGNIDPGDQIESFAQGSTLTLHATTGRVLGVARSLYA